MGSANQDVSPSTWLLPLAIVASTALGALVTFYVVREPPASAASAPSVEASTLRELAESHRSLTARVEELERALRAREIVPPVVVDGEAPAAPTPSRRAFEPARDERDSARVIDAKWIDALDKRVATALVERALTPFDPGVAVHLRTAGTAIRRANDEQRAAMQSVQERLVSGGFSSGQYQADVESLQKRCRDANAEAIRQLEAALDALAK
ncbi:MAG: hypothetical protein HZA52_12045 [Planctomycetes bacterium]|nr:hypothetical protein [Planctomycetota bacterium]